MLFLRIAVLLWAYGLVTFSEIKAAQAQAASPNIALPGSTIPSQTSTTEPVNSSFQSGLKTNLIVPAGDFQAVEDSRYKPRVLLASVIHLGKIGQIQQALLVAKAIQEPSYRSKAFAEISVSLAKNGQFEQSIRQLSEAFRLNQNDEIVFDEILFIDSDPSRFKHWEPDKYSLDRFSDTVKFPGRATIGKVKKSAFNRVVEQFAKHNKNFESLLDITQSIESNNLRNYALLTIANQYNSLGLNNEAAKALLQARLNTQSIVDTLEKLDALIAISNQYLLAGRKDEAIQILRQFEATEVEANQKDFLIEPILKASILYKHIEDKTKSVKLLNRALDFAQETKEPMSKISNLINASIGFAACNYKQKAC